MQIVCISELGHVCTRNWICRNVSQNQSPTDYGTNECNLIVFDKNTYFTCYCYPILLHCYKISAPSLGISDKELNNHNEQYSNFL